MVNTLAARRVSHINGSFSIDGFDESLSGKERLAEFFCLQIKLAQRVIVKCQRPVFNVSTKDFVRSKYSNFSNFPELQYDDFSLFFVAETGFFNDRIINALCDCFHFFDEPGFLFLSNEAKTENAKKFQSRRRSPVEIIDNFKGCFAYKEMQDYVIWYHTNVGDGIDS